MPDIDKLEIFQGTSGTRDQLRFTGDCGKQHREEPNLCRNSTSGTYIQYVIETPYTAGDVSKTSHAGKAELLAVRSLWERNY